MLSKASLEALSTAISQLCDEVIILDHTTPVSGGCINHAFIASNKDKQYFVKSNRLELLPMFEAEVKGLKLLKANCTLTIPEVIGIVNIAHEAYLVLECITPEQTAKHFHGELGVGLAKLHLQSSQQFGLDHANYIGSLPQVNDFKENFVDFFIENRLKYQLKLAVDAHKIDQGLLANFDALYNQLNTILPQEPPALLHGDLWGGNIIKDKKGNPALIDPAVYYGHREMELAFMTLFDNIPKVFYEAYNSVNAIVPGFEQRIDIYNLYPLLVHVNLFGGGYVNQVKHIVERY